MNGIECNGKKGMTFNNHHPTNVEEESIQLFAPNVVENSELVNCFQENNFSENLTLEELPNKCQLCDLAFDDIDLLMAHQIVVHPTNGLCCWECKILFVNETDYVAHTWLHDGLSASDASLKALASTATEHVIGFDTVTNAIGETSTEHLNLEKTFYLNEDNGELEEIITPFVDDIEQIGVNIDTRIDDGPFMSGADASKKENRAGQLMEVSQTNINLSKDFFKNTVMHKLKVKIPLKDFQLKKMAKVQKNVNTGEIMQAPFTTEKQKRTFPCTYCNKTYASNYRLVQHENFHTHENTYTCNACNKMFYTKFSLTNHLYTHYEEMKPLACDYEGCSKRFTSNHLLVAHARSHSDERNFVCEICHATFKHAQGLFRHSKSKHSDVSYPCMVCSNSYKASHLLTEHMRSHLEQRTYDCSECGMAFATANLRNQHKIVHATERNFKCHLCPSAFKRSSHLSTHVKRHTRTHAYKCTVCSLPFDSMSEVSAHRKTHSEEERYATRRRKSTRPTLGGEFKCPVCDKLLLTKVTLQNHLARHTDVKPYQCDLCDQSFTTESNMTNHRVIHSGMKPFPCQYCPEGFMYKEERDKHEQTHTVVNPYVCEFCDIEFTSKMSLNQHLAVHADVRRHACDFCDQRFRRRDTLDAHIRTHTGERPFACSFCTQSFKQKGDCIMHERKAHKDQVCGSNSLVASVFGEDPSEKVLYFP